MVIKKHFTNYTQNLFKAFIISSKLCLHIVQCYNDDNLVNLIQPSYNSFSTSSKILLNSSINSSPSTLSCTSFTISTVLNIIIMIFFIEDAYDPSLCFIISSPCQIKFLQFLSIPFSTTLFQISFALCLILFSYLKQEHLIFFLYFVFSVAKFKKISSL